jgi:hypothetical protein
MAFPFLARGVEVFAALRTSDSSVGHPIQMIFVFGLPVQLGTNIFLSMNVAFRFA